MYEITIEYKNNDQENWEVVDYDDAMTFLIQKAIEEKGNFNWLQISEG